MYERIIEMIEKKEFDKALNEIDKIEDSKWEKYNLKGLIYFYQNELEKSKKIFEKGLEIEPINSDLLFNYSHLLLALGEEMEARESFMRIQDKDWSIYDILGDLSIKKENFIEAIDFYKIAYSKKKSIILKEKISRTIQLFKDKYGEYKLTVALTTYNREKYLKSSIKSVLNQTFKDFILIIIDNNSSDGTKSIIDSFNKDNIFYIKNEKNIGFVGNTNKALDFCFTDYLMIVHDDDVLKPELIEREYNIIRNNKNISLIGSNRTFIDEKGKILGDFLNLKKDFLFGKHEYIKSGLTLCMPSLIYNMDFINKIGLRYRKEAGLASDTLFQYELNNYDTKIYFISEPLIYYRIHKNQWSKNTKLVIKDRIGFCNELFLIGKNDKNDFYKKISIKYLVNFIFNKFYINVFDNQYIDLYIENLTNKEVNNYLPSEYKKAILLYNIYTNKYKEVIDYKIKDSDTIIDIWLQKLLKYGTILKDLKKMGFNNVSILGEGIILYLILFDLKKNNFRVNSIISDKIEYSTLDLEGIPIYKTKDYSNKKVNENEVVIILNIENYRSFIEKLDTINLYSLIDILGGK